MTTTAQIAQPAVGDGRFYQLKHNGVLQTSWPMPWEHLQASYNRLVERNEAVEVVPWAQIDH